MSTITATTQAVSPTHSLGEPTLPALPNALLVEIAKNLTRSEMAAVARLCTATRDFRREVKYLDLSSNPARAMTLEDWETVFRQHRTFNSIDFGGHTEISIKMRDILVAALSARTMKKVIVSAATTFEYEYGKVNSWYKILWALNHMILERPTPSTLEHLDLTGAFDGSDFMNAVRVLVSRCPNLKTLRLPPLYFSGGDWERGLKLVKCLGPNLELLGPNWAPIDDEMIAEITSETCFDREKLKGCQLTFEGDSEKTTREKRWELLRFLPLSEMTTIELQGTRSYNDFDRWPADIEAKHKILSAEMVDHIAAQLKGNKKLEVLNLTGLITGEDLVPSLVRLISSIESDQLRELTLITNLEGIPDLTLIDEVLRAKLPSWKKIEKIQINSLTLSHLQPPVDAASSASSSPLDRVTELFQAEAQVNGLNYYQPEIVKVREAIDSLDLISIPTILAYYAQTHNRLVPSQQIGPNQVLDYFRNLAAAGQNINWNGPGQLIRLLENLFQREKQQVKLAQSRQIIAEQDAEYEQMMSASSSSMPAQSSTSMMSTQSSEEMIEHEQKMSESDSSMPNQSSVSMVSAPNSADSRREARYEAATRRLNLQSLDTLD